ncbi:MAG: Transcription termination factor nusa [Parcubacteria group bacterium GW2011_GWC1_38_17]|uniref:Transcription termination/antitermination protein NusA n=1 Tax=Candidatus Azambacteria bacterium RIFCSPLOWO2_01_FULL_37_9 TaxID=1797297 RepID=A0A1F5C7S3_9BACT|nr:MAG: Transcription termination factor nusa [Parcubacteria group bacterium GW2011_GWE2_37_8]KKQ58879.1 MAG: Transcription termination factor nusa [Parcubacteria group bacterium GW2011_GWC1_38_17]KKQ59554.1 MAG: Transcription termination factor nusa [Parcubacteria group bacterium GW2011_GWD1_38_16]OGD38926.1 MAG: hypothetical protein A2907_02420 [Candidatus Azambacteria bacterium RIFCSPLOWO2_01_FULL_37_9]
MDYKQFLSAINQISEEKGIQKDKVIETIEMAIAAAYKKDFGERGQIIKAKLDMETGKIAMSQVKIVVDESMLKKEDTEIEEEQIEVEVMPDGEASEDGERKVRFNPERHIIIEEAQKIKPDAQLKEEIVFELTPHEDFGRIAAQTAKQVIMQRLREAEREAVFSEYQSKKGGIISGIIQRVEGRTIFIDLGRATGVMFPYDQIPGERYRIGSRTRAYVISVETTPKGAQVILSRSHPKFLEQLFSLEVPEIASGTVEIKSVAREAGARSKIAVISNQEGVDPIGSCVGQKGTRVMAVISELGGEKIDIIEWAEDISKFIANSLSPAKIVNIEIGDRREATALVPGDQLSLAIGKGGQNVRLAAKLTGWKIDVRSMEKPEEIVEGASAEPIIPKEEILTVDEPKDGESKEEAEFKEAVEEEMNVPEKVIEKEVNE